MSIHHRIIEWRLQIMVRVASRSMADNVYSKLKEQILNLEIAPGQSLTEGLLAQTFEVSRTPIREALRMLERDQLVELIRNKGAIVRNITESDVNHIFDLRVVLEGWAADACYKKSTYTRAQTVNFGRTVFGAGTGCCGRNL